MNELFYFQKKSVLAFLFFLSIVAIIFYSVAIDQSEINPFTQSQVVKQGNTLLQINDVWYEIG